MRDFPLGRRYSLVYMETCSCGNTDELNEFIEHNVDGDALNGMLILDEEMNESLKRLSPHLGVLDTDKPRSISKNIVLHSPPLTTIRNWMYKGR